MEFPSWAEPCASAASTEQSWDNDDDVQIIAVVPPATTAKNTTTTASSSKSLSEKRERIELFGEPNSANSKSTMEIFRSVDMSTIDIDVRGHNAPAAITAFADAKLHPRLQQNIALANYACPSPIQRSTIPVAIAVRDLMACAQTGSGKTAAFLLPSLHRFLTNEPLSTSSTNDSSLSSTDAGMASPYVLVLAPTRELATQIHHEARRFGFGSSARSICCYGGHDIRMQLRALRGGCDVAVATPGRLLDLIERRAITLQHVQVLILDEADRMLDMGFEPQLRRVIEQTNASIRQTLMFSATFPAAIQKLATDFLRQDFVFVSVGRVGAACSSIEQRFEFTEEIMKRDVLMKLLPTLGDALTLVFVRTKRTAEHLTRYLKIKKVPVTSIHGDRTQEEREDALDDFRSGRCRILVATDVAARGLDVKNIGYVINFDLPTQIDDYVHRIGRTGRAGDSGCAISFFTIKDLGIVEALHTLLCENHQVVPEFLHRLLKDSNRRAKNSAQYHHQNSRHPYDATRSRDNEGRSRGRERRRGRGSSRSGHGGRGNRRGSDDEAPRPITSMNIG